MFPLWFFIILVAIICYLLILTRPSEQSIVMIGKDKWRKFQKVFRSSSRI